MRADEAYAELDDNTLFLTAIGRPNRGRILGFGSMLEKRVQTSTNRERQSHVASYVSGLTNSGVQETFSRAEVDAIVQDRDRRIAEEREERMRDQAQNQLLFSQLFKMHGLLKPPSHAPASTHELPQDGILGNTGYSQAPASAHELPQDGILGNTGYSQDVDGSSHPNQDGSFQALLSSHNGQEIAGNDAAMTDWWGNQPSG